MQKEIIANYYSVQSWEQGPSTVGYFEEKHGRTRDLAYGGGGVTISVRERAKKMCATPRRRCAPPLNPLLKKKYID